jgi:hypothetical protein
MKYKKSKIKITNQNSKTERKSLPQEHRGHRERVLNYEF